jgi:hypothetical protein
VSVRSCNRIPKPRALMPRLSTSPDPIRKLLKRSQVVQLSYVPNPLTITIPSMILNPILKLRRRHFHHRHRSPNPTILSLSVCLRIQKYREPQRRDQGIPNYLHVRHQFHACCRLNRVGAHPSRQRASVSPSDHGLKQEEEEDLLSVDYPFRTIH